MTRAGPGPGPDAERAGAGSTRSPRDAVAPRSPTGDGAPVLGTVPRPAGGGAEAAVVVLDPATTAGGLSAVQAEWGVDGGAVVLSGRGPFTELTGHAGFRSDGSLDGSVEMRARVGLLGLNLGEATWRVEGWAPEQPLAGPAVTLRGTTLGVDLRPLPAEAGWSAPEGVDAPRSGAQATIHLPGDATPPGLPLTPRVAEVYRGLLGVDVSGIRVHPDSPVAGAPAFVTDADLFLAPGVYGVDSPEMLAVLDAAIRAALGGLFGAVTGESAPLVPPAPPTPAAPPADTTVVPATVPEPASPSTVAEGAAARTGEAPATGETAEQATAAVAGAGAAGADAGTAADGIPGGGAGEPTAEGEAAPAVVELIMPEPPTTLTPAATARGGSVAGGARSAAGAARDLPTADANVADSRGAVTEPAAETAARAREELAAELGERPAPSPEIVALCERIRTAIRENRPEDEDQLLETDPTHEAQAAGATITGSVETQTAEVGSSYDAMGSPPAGTPALTPTPIAAPSPTSPGMGVDAAGAAPDPIPPENTSLDADVAATDQRIADAGIDTRVTQEIPDGPFAEARAARGELGEAAARTPQQIQAEQQQAIDTAQGDMAALQQQAVAAMRASRSGTVGAVGGAQGGMVTSEEQTRESVSARAQGIYDQAQTQVNALLEPLSRTAIARWDAGLARLSQDFHDTLDRVKRWIDDRHSGVGGAILAVGDYIGGLPDWVTDEYNRAEREFGDGVCTLLTDISSDVNGVVAAAQAVINHARDDIDTAFRAMEAEFPEWAAQERARFSGMLDGLSQRVTDAQTSFVRDVSQRAVQAVNEVHAEAQARRDEAGGLIGRVVAAIEEFIDDPVRAIINGLLRLVGIPPAAFWALIARIEQVISDIADDPENFINNLVAGVKQGFEQFFDHFGTHVLHGFWDWLFSGLETPIPMPRDFSARSLFSFALQLMGVTWPRVREILVRHIGPTAVDVIEAAWQLVSVLIERGPEGLVELVKEQLTPENIVTMILDAAVQYLVETLIQQVVVRVIGMLNPVGAIAQAIDLIYQVCSWIFRNAARIFRFVEAIVNGMADVIAGNIGGLAAAVERSLASLIPPVIDFLAGLCHLGGLPGEIADVITRMQAVVYAAMDRVIGFLAERGRALLARMGIGGNPDEGGHNDDTELGTTVRFSAAHEAHRLWFERNGSGAHLMVASTPTTIPDLIVEWNRRLAADEPSDPDLRSEARNLIINLRGDAATADAEASRLVGQFDAASRDTTHQTAAPDDNALESSERSIASTLDRLFTIFGEGDRAQQIGQIRASLPVKGLEQTGLVVQSWMARFIEPTRAKPIEGAEGPVWSAADFTADALQPSEVLGSGTNHAALLSFFEAGVDRRGGADSDAFRSYAFENMSAPHPVRRRFLTSLGSRTASQLRSLGTGRLTGTGDSDLLTKVRSIRYSSSGGTGYGSFEPWPSNPVSVLVHGVVTSAGPLEAFRAFVQGLTVGAVSYDEFRAELERDQTARTWVAGQIRDVRAGQHEWLPVSIGYEVLHHAVETSRQDLRQALGWISLLESLRSPTNGILWRITRDPILVQGGPVEEGTQIGAQGHVASLSLERFRLVQDGLTTGTGDFHGALRTFFRQNRGLEPAAWVDALLAHLPSIMWTGSNIAIPGELRSRPIGVFYAMPSGVFAPDLTVAQVQAEQQARWEEIRAAFLAAKAGIP